MKVNLLFAFAPLMSALLTAITIPLMTWFFSVEDIGRYSVLQVVVILSTILAGLGMDQAYVREYHSSRACKTENLFVNHVFLGFIVLCLLLIIVSYNESIVNNLFDTQNSSLLYIVFLVVLITYFFNFISVYFRLIEDPVRFSLVQVLPKFLFFIFLIIINIFQYNKFEGIVSSLSLSLVFTWVFILFVSKEVRSFFSFKCKLDVNYIRKVLIYSFPTMLSALLLWLTLATDRFALKYFSTLSELGLYTVAFSLAGLGMILQSIFSMLWFPKVYEEFEKTGKYDRLEEVLGIMLLLVLLVFIALSFLSPLLPYLFPIEYKGVQSLMLASVLYPLFLVMSEITGIGLGLKRKMWFNFLAFIIVFCVNIFLNVLLVPYMGAKGAVISSGVSFFIYLVIKSEISHLVWENFRRTRVYAYGVYMLVVAIVSTINLNNTLLQIMLFLGLFSLPVFFKSEFVFILKTLRIHLKNNK